MDVDDDDDDDVADKSRRTFSGPRSLEFPTRKTKTNEISLSLLSPFPRFLLLPTVSTDCLECVLSKSFGAHRKWPFCTCICGLYNE